MMYPGGKNQAGVYQKLINMMPPHQIYVEPFLGSGAVIRMKRAARFNVGLDLAISPIQAVAAGIAKSDGGARQPPPHVVIFPAGTAESVVRAYTAKTDGVRSPQPWFGIGVADAMEFLDSWTSPNPSSTLIYCDPPYLLSTRKSGRRLYEYDLTSAVDHRLFCRVVKKQGELGSMVMVSGYDSALYREEFAGWRVESFQAVTRGGRVAVEYVWLNFPTPTTLHDTQFAGGDYRERERIKKKKLRWVERIKKLDPVERQALLEAITAAATGPTDGNNGTRATPKLVVGDPTSQNNEGRLGSPPNGPFSQHACGLPDQFRRGQPPHEY